jgi:hypothetical protein
MKWFKSFSDHPFGGWVIEGLAVVAFILALKVAVSKVPDKGIPGAIKAGIQSI